jgi:DNA-binding NtrC family response regulator
VPDSGELGGGGRDDRAMLRVLVVDDEPDMADSIAYFVRRAGYDVETTTSGADALARMAGTQFDIVLTDLKMPRISGLTLLDEIKQRDADVEVLVVTGHPEVETAVQAIKHGAFDYVTKPFDESQLMERVEKAAARC